ncbi:MAG: hypothetical protein AABX38_02990 [Candidatus Micrarchaeota archaeon]
MVEIDIEYLELQEQLGKEIHKSYTYNLGALLFLVIIPFVTYILLIWSQINENSLFSNNLIRLIALAFAFVSPLIGMIIWAFGGWGLKSINQKLRSKLEELKSKEKKKK